MLLNRLIVKKISNMLLGDLDTAFVVFDKNDKLIMNNIQANFIMPDNTNCTLEEFAEYTGIAEKLISFERDGICLWRYRSKNGIDTTYRVEYRVVKDNKNNRPSVKMFSFTPESNETDSVTGFLYEPSINDLVTLSEGKTKYPVGIMLLDIKRLSYINELSGKDEGDKALALLASILRRFCPDNSVFVRLRDGILLTISEGIDANALKIIRNEVRIEFAKNRKFAIPLAFNSYICEATSSHIDLEEMIKTGIKYIAIRKIMTGTPGQESILETMTQIQMEFDDDMSAHIRRTTVLADRFGTRLGLSDKQNVDLQLLCLVHDIGQVGVPLSIINKPGRLTDDEWQLMLSHVEKGYRILSSSEMFEEISSLVLHHHEAWDGSGYPDGLSKDAIPYLSRVLAIIDTFDAMTNDRPYRKAVSPEKAVELLKKAAGTMFDPVLVDVFANMLNLGDGDGEKVKEDNPVPSMGAVSKDTSGNINEVKYSRYVLDADGVILEIDDEFERITGYSKENIKTGAISQWDLIFPEDTNEYQRKLDESFRKNQEAYINHRIRKKDGSEIRVFCYGKLIFDEVSRDTRTIVIINDISDNSSSEDRDVRKLAKRDNEKIDLDRKDKGSGLYNRKTFVEEADVALTEHRSVFVGVISVDQYVEMVRQSEPYAGDKLIKYIGEVLKNILPSGSLIGRTAVGEVTILLKYSDSVGITSVESEAAEIWGTVMEGIAMPYPNITISLGAIYGSGDNLSFRNIYDRAIDCVRMVRENPKRCYLTEKY